MNTTHRTDHYDQFANLHNSSTPMILVNVWDAGSARAAAGAGAPALATGSWAVAAAHGYDDGQHLPLELAVQNILRITAAVDVPVSVDAEQGYGQTPADVAATIQQFKDAGAIGTNLEDAVDDATRRSVEDAADRIRAVRGQVGDQFWINARTDVFFQTAPEAHGAALAETIERSHAYKEAGANSLFVPGLTNPELIRTLVAESNLPINVMATTSADVQACRPC